MVRLADLPDYEREHLLAKNMPPLGPASWVANEKPLAELRIALVTTAGLHFRNDPAFKFADATFRPISNDENANDLIMSHSCTEAGEKRNPMPNSIKRCMMSHVSHAL